MGLKKRVKELERELIEVKEENKFLKQTIKAFEKRIEELEGIIKEKSVPAFVKKDIKEEPKKSGQKEGHEGCSRNKPERIDEVVEHKLEICPICGEPVSDTQEIRERITEDIEEPKTKNTKHLIHRCYCKNCNKLVEPEIYTALPNSRFGLRLMILVLILKLDCRIPSNKVTSILDSVFGLKISDGEVYNILKQLSEAFGDYHEKLVRKIKEALGKHIDETSWRINGKNYWLWIFINNEVALFVVRKKRSSKVPIEILGNQEGKFVTSDRLPAYDELAKKSGCKQQICWTHILRNAREEKEKNPEAKYVYERFSYIFGKSKKKNVSNKKLLHWIDLIAGRDYQGWKIYKLVKSVCVKHKEDLFRFRNNPEIGATNNLAERGLRHAVIIRKISNGSRSEEGAETTAKLLSVLQTIKLQTNNPYEGLLNLLQKPE